MSDRMRYGNSSIMIIILSVWEIDVTVLWFTSEGMKCSQLANGTSRNIGLCNNFPACLAKSLIFMCAGPSVARKKMPCFLYKLAQ